MGLAECFVGLFGNLGWGAGVCRHRALYGGLGFGLADWGLAGVVRLGGERTYCM